MKKLTFIIVISFLLYTSVSIGQDNPLHYGVKLGLVNSTMAKNFQNLGYSRIGITGGAFASYDLKKSLSVEADVLYTQQGITNTLPLTTKNYPTSTNICFHTIEVPLLLSFNSHDIDGITPRIFLGHSFGYILSAIASNREQFDVAPVKYFYTKEDVSSKFNNLDFGIVMGIGISFKVGSHNLILDARYKFGYTNINTSAFDKYSNNALTITAGLTL